jgi:hypothetical protein
VDTSGFDPLLGMSSYQFGMLARSNHKCQGAGQLRAQPGTGRAVYVLVDAEPKISGPEDDILAGVETSLSAVARFARGQEDKAPLPRRQPAQHRRPGEASAGGLFHARRRPHAHGLRAGLASLVKTRESLAETALDEAAKYEITARLRRKEADFARALTLAQRVTTESTADDGDVVPGSPSPCTRGSGTRARRR